MMLERTLHHLKACSPGRHAVEFAITPLDVTDVPVWSVTNWQADGEMINGIGYGSTDIRARVGAWAELLEQVGSHTGAKNFEKRTATFNTLDGKKIDPRSLRLPAGTSYAHNTPLTWVKVRRFEPGTPLDQQPLVWAPIEAAATHNYDLGPDAAPLYQCVSNGNGAGDTMERALCHGLLELVQRDGNSAGYRAVDRGIRIELDDVRDPETRALLDRLDNAGIEVVAKLADTNLGMTNLYVVGHEREPAKAPHPIVLSGCGEAAHPNREEALKKALLEFCASRVRKLFTHGPIEIMEHLLPDGYLERFGQNPATVEESRSFEEVRRLSHMSASDVMDLLAGNVFRIDETVKFSDLPTCDAGGVDTIPKLLDVVADRLEAEGLPIYWAEYLKTDTCAACKAIVPAMEVETMTYHRVGRRNIDRLIGRGFDCVGYGVPPDGAEPVLLDDDTPAWMNTRDIDRIVGDLYCLYREPEIHAIALAKD
jgi:ribosomal protein S12 methylthiotransferase accessory factor